MVARLRAGVAAVVATLADVTAEFCADATRARESRATIEAIVERRREEGLMDCSDGDCTMVRRNR